MILTERQTEQGLLVTACDPEILGETFENDEVSLEVTESFYGGDKVDARDVVDALSRASVANLVGTEVVELAIEEGFIDEERVLEIETTLHAQYLRF